MKRRSVGIVIAVLGVAAACRMPPASVEPSSNDAVTNETPPPEPEPEPEPEPKVAEPEPAPASEPAAAPEAKIEGALDRDIIRRVVRAHIHEIRDCYNAGLAGNPGLRGNVTLDFVIAGDGTVASAVVHQSTLQDAEVAKCIAKAASSWLFPSPEGGGNVTVRYPFNLVPG